MLFEKFIVDCYKYGVSFFLLRAFLFGACAPYNFTPEHKMSSRVLCVFFKVGHIFGITPWSLQVPKISPLKKLYYILIFLIPTQCLLTREVLNFHTQIRENIILYVFNTICFIGQDFTLLLRNFQNRKSWVSFLQNLKTTARILPKTTSKHSFYCGFFFMNFVYLVTTILVLYIYPCPSQLPQAILWRVFPLILCMIFSTSSCRLLLSR